MQADPTTGLSSPAFSQPDLRAPRCILVLDCKVTSEPGPKSALAVDCRSRIVGSVQAVQRNLRDRWVALSSLICIRVSV